MPTTRSFLQDLLTTIADRSKSVVDQARRATGFAPDLLSQPLPQLVASLLSGRGEASGVALAREVVSRYEALDSEGRKRFLLDLATVYGPDVAAIRQNFAAFDADPSHAHFQALVDAVEPPRQEIIRRLNLAPGNTAALVNMRADLLSFLPQNPELAALNSDFTHLFTSWFNRGFLVLRHIDWSTPADILDKIIRYEAVHAIDSFDDLRRRIEPKDRRCFAFFHPALLDEPLIFVEVALTTDIPDAIAPILTAGRIPLNPADATTAVFYSISNCQKGLAGISFGNFLIKQVVEELRREQPKLSTFVTLSPVPGFARWLEAAAAEFTDDEREQFDWVRSNLDSADATIRDQLGKALKPWLARYLVQARSSSGRVLDPVARFHLGNGARLEKLNGSGDLSAKGLRESYGTMVNYLYDPGQIEENHERFATQNDVVAAPAVTRYLDKAKQTSKSTQLTRTNT